MSFRVLFSAGAEEDLQRLFDFQLDRATTVEDLAHAQDAISAIRQVVDSHLGTMPFSYRKAGASATRRELVVPFGASGYVVLYEIAGPAQVVVLAVRHQREEDYH